MITLSGQQADRIRSVCECFGIRVLLLFGSHVSGRTHRESDVDLAYAGRKLNFEEHAAFNAELQAIVGAARVETVDLFAASPLLRYRIFNEHRTLHLGDRLLYHRLASYAIKSYLETKELRENLRRRLEHRYAGR